MKLERRKFLRQLAGACATGVARNLGIAAASAVAAGAAASGGAAAVAAPAVAAARAAVLLSPGVRAQVFEVIVRQAAAGAPWKQICEGPMRVNQITPEEVEAELKRRIVHDPAHHPCLCRECLRQAHAARQARLDAIPHSEQAPCACNDCSAMITQIRTRAVVDKKDVT